MKVQRRLVVLVSLVVALAVAAPASAGIWTPISSGTTGTISAIDYRGAGQLWYTTTSGQILKNGAVVGSFPGITLNDIAMSPDATRGIAVGDAGKIYWSNNGGATWNAPAAAVKTFDQTCPISGVGPYPQVTVTDPVVAVAWLDNTTAYAIASPPPSSSNQSEIQKTSDGGQHWSEINRAANGDCKVNSKISDVKPVPGSASIYFISQYFGDVYFTADGLASTAIRREGMVNCYDQRPRLAIDPSNFNHVFAADRCNDTLSLEYSEDGAASATRFQYSPDDSNPGTWDVAFAGGTVLAAGNAGAIFNSVDGRNAYRQAADGSLATNDWRAVALADAGNGAVGGVGGALVTTTQANSIPDLVAPAGTVTGPTTATAGTPVTYTANVSDNAGGSGINASSFAWSATGLPAASGNPVTLTFPSAGFYNVQVSFKDNAGNLGTASLSVFVSAASSTPPPPTPPKATKTTTASVPGASIKFGVPSGCVAPGSTFRVTLTWKKAKRKGNRFVKVRRADFYIGSKRVKIDKKAPFVQTLTVTASAKPGSEVKLRARAYIKVKRGKSPTKSIRSTIKVCG
jgi:hypothetical protein